MDFQQLKDRLQLQLSKLLRTGFFHIVGAGSINKVLSALLSFVLVRILSKADYGAYAYAYNIVSFFVMLNGFGVVPAVLQMCSELHDDKEKAAAIFRYGYKRGFAIDSCFVFVLAAAGAMLPSAIEGSGLLLLVYCTYPLTVFLFEIKMVYLRARFMNKQYALSTNIQTVLLVIFSLLGAFLFQAVGLVVGQILAYFLAYAYLSVRYPLARDSKYRLMPSDKKDFWNISALSALNEFLSRALSLIGTLFVGWLLADNDAVATYQIATLIPFSLLFLPNMVMTYAYAYFAQRINDRTWTIRNYAKLTGGCIAMMGFITTIIVIFAEPIVLLLFGESYRDAIHLLRILMIGFFVQSAFRAPASNLLVTQRKLVASSIIGLLTISFSIILNISLIANYSLNGAAIAYDATVVFGALLYSVLYLGVLAKKPKTNEAT